MPQESFALVKGRSLRITSLEDCCAPPPTDTECALSVFDAYTILSISAEIEEGEELLVKKANGDICVSEKDPNALKWLNVTLTFCQWLPEVVQMLTGWPVIRDADGVAVGNDIMQGISDNSVAVESWSSLAGVDCGQGARYGYAVLPCVSGWQVDGDFNLASGISEDKLLTLTATTSGSHGWGTGPYAVQLGAGGTAGPLLSAMQTGSLARIMTTGVPAPAITDGCVAASAANGYLYGPPPVVAPVPTITAVDPTSGPEAGGNTVTITGTGFQEGA